MTSALKSMTAAIRELCRDVVHGWDGFWFTPQHPAPLALVRMLTAAVLLWVHLVTWAQLPDIVGDHAWLDGKAVHEMRLLAEGRHARDYTDPGGALRPFSGPSFDDAGNLRRDAAGNVVVPSNRWWGTFSIWHFLPESSGLVAVAHVVFLVAVLCVFFGLGTRVALILAWLGHVSYVQRGMVIYSGMDSILLLLLIYLCIGPSGAVCSLDAWIARWRKRGNEFALPGVTANLALRLIQVHLCLIYFCAGAAKLQGPTWWNGTAVYLLMMSPEYGGIPVEWLVRNDTLWQVVSLVGGVFTVAFELSFAFLIWQGRLRPLVLLAGLFLHAMVALTSGLGAFQMTMVAALLAFVRPDLAAGMLRPRHAVQRG